MSEFCMAISVAMSCPAVRQMSTAEHGKVSGKRGCLRTQSSQAEGCNQAGLDIPATLPEAESAESETGSGGYRIPTNCPGTV